MVCFTVMEVVKQFEIPIFHTQELGFPYILSACVQYMSGLHFVLGKLKWEKMLRNAKGAQHPMFSPELQCSSVLLLSLLRMHSQTSRLCLPGNCVTHLSEFSVQHYQALASEIPVTSWI